MVTWFTVANDIHHMVTFFTLAINIHHTVTWFTVANSIHHMVTWFTVANSIYHMVTWFTVANSIYHMVTWYTVANSIYHMVTWFTLGNCHVVYCSPWWHGFLVNLCFKREWWYLISSGKYALNCNTCPSKCPYKKSGLQIGIHNLKLNFLISPPWHMLWLLIRTVGRGTQNICLN